jgi:spore germination protein GerM
VAVVDMDEKFLSYDTDNSKASDAVVQSLVLSIVETGVAEEVQVSVNGETELVTMEGKTLSEPVSRSGSINAAGF